MNLIEYSKEKLKEKSEAVLSDTSHEGENKRLGIPIYLSGILLAIMGANYIFNFKDNLVALVNQDYYSDFLTIIHVIFQVFLFVFVSSFCFSIIAFIIYFLLYLIAHKVHIFDKPAEFMKNLSLGCDYRSNNTFTWLFFLFLLMAATQPNKITTDINLILLFFGPIKYLAYLSIIPTIIFTFTNIISLKERFLSCPTKIFINKSDD